MNKSTFSKKRVDAFTAWLAARGASVLRPTSEWELLRFSSDKGTSIVYTDKVGCLTFTGQAAEAWKAFASQAPWRAAPATARRARSKPMAARIRERDGGLCFFCQLAVDVEDESTEHLVAVTHGGPNHISNLFLAHKTCNARAGHLSAPEKVRMHVRAVLSTHESVHQ